MRFRVWSAQLTCYLLLGGLLLSAPYKLAVAHECCLTTKVNPVNIMSSSYYPGLEQEMLLLTNQHRNLRGLPELVLDEALTQIAREHSIGMAQQGFISHNLHWAISGPELLGRAIRFKLHEKMLQALPRLEWLSAL